MVSLYTSIGLSKKLHKAGVDQASKVKWILDDDNGYMLGTSEHDLRGWHYSEEYAAYDREEIYDLIPPDDVRFKYSKTGLMICAMDWQGQKGEVRSKQAIEAVGQMVLWLAENEYPLEKTSGGGGGD